MAYVDLGAVWVDYSNATCPSGQYAWRDDPTGTGQYVTRYCSPTAPGDSFISLNKIDRAKYDLITLNAGTQVVSKGEQGLGPDINTLPVPTTPPPTGRIIIRDGRALTDSEVQAELRVRSPEIAARCKEGGGTPKYDADGFIVECYVPPSPTATVKRLVLDPTTGQYVDTATGLTADKHGNPIQGGLNQQGMLGGLGSNAMLILAAGFAVGGIGYYIYKKRKGKGKK